MVKEVQVLLLSLMNNTPNLWLKGRNYCIHLSPHLLFPRADIISLYMQMNLMEFNESLFTLYVGITTLVGGGTGPTAGTRATTCTPAPSQMKLMLQSTDDLPLNFGFTGKVCCLFDISSVYVLFFLSYCKVIFLVPCSMLCDGFKTSLSSNNSIYFLLVALGE